MEPVLGLCMLLSPGYVILELAGNAGRQAFTVEAKAITRKEHTQKRHARIRQKVCIGLPCRCQKSMCSNLHSVASVLAAVVWDL